MPAIQKQSEVNSYAYEFIKSDAPGELSFEAGTLVAGAGQERIAGTVLGKITATGKFTILAPAAADGSQLVAGILCQYADATVADQKVAVLVRLAEVEDARLTWPVGITGPQLTLARTQMAALNILAR